MKVMLVDDHMLFLEGLQYLLETYGINVVEKATNAREALTKAKVCQPDIILLDIRMPELSGIDALKMIKAEMNQIKIIMLTTSDDDEDLFEAIKYGASGYLLKNTDASKLIDLLKDVDNNMVPLSPGIAMKLMNEFVRKREEKSTLQGDKNDCRIDSCLTDRHLEILELLAQGKTYKEIGNQLCLTERTVKYHMGRILELLHLENRAQLLSYVAHRGMPI
jgi:two-component system NarL family response regulator